MGEIVNDGYYKKIIPSDMILWYVVKNKVVATCLSRCYIFKVIIKKIRNQVIMWREIGNLKKLLWREKYVVTSYFKNKINKDVRFQKGKFWNFQIFSWVMENTS